MSLVFVVQAGNLQLFGERQCLFGHAGAVTALTVCRPYSVLVSAGVDASAIVWDLNRLSYVRSVRAHASAIDALTVSDTLGDIAMASRAGEGVVQHLVDLSISCETSFSGQCLSDGQMIIIVCCFLFPCSSVHPPRASSLSVFVSSLPT